MCTAHNPVSVLQAPGVLSSGHRVKGQCPRMRRQERFPRFHGRTRSEGRFLVVKTRKFSSHGSRGGRVPEARGPGLTVHAGRDEWTVPLRPIRASQRKSAQSPRFLQLRDLGQGGRPLCPSLCSSLEQAKTPRCRGLREELLTAPEEAQLGGPVLL